MQAVDLPLSNCISSPPGHGRGRALAEKNAYTFFRFKAALRTGVWNPDGIKSFT